MVVEERNGVALAVTEHREQKREADARFCHLHLHTDYSALDGGCTVDQVTARAAELGMPAVAITDHGVLSGVLHFYRSAVERGIKPILGLEAYVVEDRHRKDSQQEDRWHLTLLAENNKGYRNLLRLSSRAFLEGYYFKPRVDYELLSEHSDGLFCLSGCPSGRLSRALMKGSEQEAREDTERLLSIFGKGNVFLEIQCAGIKELEDLPPRLADLSETTGLPLVATNDVHYLGEEDAEAHDVLLCIQTGSRREEENRLKFSSQEFYLKSEKEMREAFRDYPEAVDNTLLVAERCEVELSFDQILLPSFETPAGESEPGFLRGLCREGMLRRYGDSPPEGAEERLEMELAVIEEMGFSAYFLIVWDFVEYAKKEGIPVGPGRGSAAGSLVAYLLGITDLDPIQFDLLFERFLNPSRISMPDIDIDFSVAGRDRVIEYVAEKYGRDRVAQIATFGTIKARQAIRDAARVMDVPYSEGDRIAKMIPEGPSVTLADCMKKGRELADAYQEEEMVRRVVDMARPLEGLIRQDSIHAAGVVISDRPLTELLPLQQKGDSEVVTQVPMGDVESLGLLKMDFLGLRNLDVIAGAVRIIRESGSGDFDIDSIPMDDSKTFEMLAQGDSEGVFQLESSGMRDAMREVNPSTFDDLIALVALYRPGPMEYIPQFVRNKRDPERVKYVDSRLEPVLRPTYGVAVYQEQLMEIAKRIAGFTPSEADDLRKGIGKKIRAVLERLEPKFREGAQENGTAPKAIDYLWNLMEKAGDYSFNKSHAACYALIAYRTAYLKANYPVEYMAALISSVMNTKDKVPFYVAVADEMGIEVLPPDVNESALDFRAVDGRIRFGLNAVKNVGVGAITYILEEREAGGPFEDIFEFCERVDTAVLNKRALESLIKCGALDSTGSSRKGMLHVLAQAVGHGQKVQSDAALGQGSIFDLMDAGTEQDQGGVAGGGNGYSNGSRSAEIPAGDFSQEEKLALEKEALGLYVSAHPLHDLRHQIRKEAENLISELPGLSDGASTTVVGMVSRVKQITTKAGEPMAFVTLDGLEGSVEVLCFPKFFGKHRELMKEDMVVKVRGKVDRKDETDTKIVPFRVESFAARREDDPICIVLEDKNLPKNTLGALKSLLAHFPGSCPIEVYIKGDEGNFRLRFGDQYRVDPQTSLFAELKVLLGDGKVSRGQPVAVG